MDWPNTFEGCRGTKQSPVLLPASGVAAKALGQPDAKSSFSYGTLSNAKIVNNGHSLQVTLPADFTSDVKIPVKGEGRAPMHVTAALSGGRPGTSHAAQNITVALLLSVATTMLFVGFAGHPSS
jgi:hypothetical protein